MLFAKNVIYKLGCEVINALSNLRPMWKKDNEMKYNKWDLDLYKLHGHDYWRYM